MGRFFCAWLVLVLSTLFGACGSGGTGDIDGGTDGGEQLCDLDEHACPEGERCNAERQCVAADALEIVTESLPDGRVGFGYDETLAAAGGLPPYTWEIVAADPGLGFLELSRDGRLQGTAQDAVADAALRLAVQDSGYGGGVRVVETFRLTFARCSDGDTELCYAPVDGVCYQGQRVCSDGQMGPCEPGDNPSSDRNHCGPECDRCAAQVADACHQGVCACGAGPLCTGSDNCCDGDCVDVQSNTTHCGMCFNDCTQAVAHASEADKFCSAGVCDYAGACDYGYLDCDDQHGNGCERPADRVDTCGACDLDCNQQVLHVPAGTRTCNDTGDGFVCDYSGGCSNDFADCDGDRSSGCETWLNDPANCGGCGVDCSQDPNGALCISPDPADPYFHECGCNYDSAAGQPEGCGGGQICCEHVCRDAATDPEHCGVCRAACSAGGCQDGACACGDDGDCPAESAATTCGPTDACVCSHAGAGDAPCPLGQFCCDGEHGGSGGPEGEADLGCCSKRCGQNDSEDFPCSW